MLNNVVFSNDYSWRNWARIICVAALLGIASTASGATLKKVVEVQPFERIYVRGAVSLHVEQNSQQKIYAEASDTILDALVIESSDGVLFIETPDDHVAEELVIHLSVANLKEIVSIGTSQVRVDALDVSELALDGSGAAQFELQDVHVDDLYINGSGTSQFEVSGQAKRQVIDLAGLGSYQGGNLASETSEVVVHGGGDVAVQVEEVLDVNIVGSAKVEYLGAPFVVQQVLGSGVVDRVLPTN